MCTAVRQTLTSDGNALAQGKFLSKQIGVDRVSTEKSWRRVVCGHLHRARNELHRSSFFQGAFLQLPGANIFTSGQVTCVKCSVLKLTTDFSRAYKCW